MTKNFICFYIDSPRNLRHTAVNTNCNLIFRISNYCAEQWTWPASIKDVSLSSFLLHFTNEAFVLHVHSTYYYKGARTEHFLCVMSENGKATDCAILRTCLSKVLLLMDSIWALARTYHSSLYLRDCARRWWRGTSSMGRCGIREK